MRFALLLALFTSGCIAATAEPMRPTPRRPSVWPRILMRRGMRLKSQLLSRAILALGKRPRAKASNKAIAWSATSSMQ